MFGYVRIFEDELLVRNLKLYKQSYCALCRQIGCFAQSARLMLSYDMVFCVLLSECAIPLDNHPCRNKILRRCKKKNGDARLRYIAAVSIFLQYHKLRDDCIDGKKSRKMPMKAIEHGYLVAKKEFPEVERMIYSTMSELLAMEKDCCKDLNALEGLFPKMLYNVFALAPWEDSFSRIRGRISFHIAACVYWMDMIQDLEEDKKEHNYNAILLFDDENEAIDTLKSLIMEHLAEAEELCDLLPYSDNVAIVRNIITMGLPQQFKKLCEEVC